MVGAPESLGGYAQNSNPTNIHQQLHCTPWQINILNLKMEVCFR